jgi:hypothetical protein
VDFLFEFNVRQHILALGNMDVAGAGLSADDVCIELRVIMSGVMQNLAGFRQSALKTNSNVRVHL